MSNTTKAKLKEIELRALRATANPRIVINNHYSCGTPTGYGEPYRDGISYVHTGWHDVTYSYELRTNSRRLYQGLITVPHGGRIGTEPKEKPKASADDLFFEQARADVLWLLSELKKQ